MTRLEVGQHYVARGPSPAARPANASKNTSGWWEPATVLVVAIDEAKGHYVTEGTRQAASVIAFGCEHHWQKV